MSARLWRERVAFRVHGWTHPYAYRQMRRGSGAWGRVTRRDKQRRAERLAWAAEQSWPRREWFRDETGALRLVREPKETT